MGTTKAYYSVKNEKGEIVFQNTHINELWQNSYAKDYKGNLHEALQIVVGCESTHLTIIALYNHHSRTYELQTSEIEQYLFQSNQEIQSA